MPSPYSGVVGATRRMPHNKAIESAKVKLSFILLSGQPIVGAKQRAIEERQNTKTGKRRSVPLNKVASEAILNRMRFRAQHVPASPWVFTHRNGQRIQDVKRAFASACRRAGITDFRIHDLRHTSAAWLVSAGVPLAEVRDFLGHTTVKITERYAHLPPRTCALRCPFWRAVCHDRVTLGMRSNCSK